MEIEIWRKDNDRITAVEDMKSKTIEEKEREIEVLKAEIDITTKSKRELETKYNEEKDAIEAEREKFKKIISKLKIL